MDSPIFYAPPENIEDGVVNLSRDEAHHAVNVLRLREADLVIIVNGLGTAYRGAVSKISRRNKTVTVAVHSEVRNFGEPSVILTLAAGLSSDFKFSYLVEKGTELGVKRFVPLLTSKSKIKLHGDSKARAKRTRLEKVALSAIKQCRRSYCPEIALPVNIEEYLKEIEPESLNLIFHPDRKARLLEQVIPEDKVRRVSLLIGPESGFSDDEYETAVERGYVPVSLGSRILRTETAGPVVVALVMNLLGELR